MTETKIVKVHHWYGNDSGGPDYDAILCDDGTLIPLEDEVETCLDEMDTRNF